MSKLRYCEAPPSAEAPREISGATWPSLVRAQSGISADSSTVQADDGRREPVGGEAARPAASHCLCRPGARGVLGQAAGGRHLLAGPVPEPGLR
ncbi:hypothetical protein [Streptomyces lonarensis]|uniref:Uncharacterized protein n=1 Tax=Streptomyces lonarensis TaxID=700599 RepID=A0A7X6D4U9_9ACTN|nr:hypothetical protein [Streptomyces lonarensis]NJQ08207.1 hypothetical protein [Streptomyces lonarensis]